MNDIVTAPARAPVKAAQNTDQQRAIAEVQAAMMIARANPRDHIAAMDRIRNACTRPGLADAAIYSYARGGSDISGPSIRLAEAMAQAWGNLQFGIRELDQANGESTVQAYAWDIETNTRREITFQVPHTRHTKKGVTTLSDPRDIYELVANQGARRLRACILAVIPGDVTEAAVAQCDETMRAKADISPEAMQKMLTAFQPFGVTKEQIEKRIQRRLDAIQPAQVISLKKIYASLRDGMSAHADWFDAVDVETETPSASRTEAVKAKARANMTQEKSANGGNEDGGLGILAQSIIDQIAAAPDKAALDRLTGKNAAEIEQIKAGIPDRHADIMSAIAEKANEFYTPPYEAGQMEGDK